MMKRSCNSCHLSLMLLLAVALLFTVLPASAHAESDSPNILIINSYHKGLQWTDKELEGIISSLKESGYDSGIYVEYMDWKRYPSEENLSCIYDRFEYKYSHKPIDIIITTDDIALEFALENRAALLPDAPVVFCGVNDEGINKPDTFLEEHRDIIITVMVVFLLLITFIIILVHYLRKITIMKRELQVNNEELIKSSNTLQRQYDELEKVQKELTGSEERYSLLFKRMLNGFIIFEPVFTDKGKIVDVRFKEVNPAYELQNGLSRDELVGKAWKEVHKHPNRNLGRYNRILSTGEPMQFETYHRHNNKYYLINAFKISDCQVGIVGEDITEYKNAIKEITVLNEELERRVAERTGELQSAVSELEAFTYTVSHDLKSPIRAIDGYSRIIMEDLGDKLGEEGNEMLRNIRDISRDMIEMISKLLQYSTTSKAPIDKEKLDAGALVSSIFNELLSANPGRNIKLVVETGLPEILADKVMIKQAIYNILSNAVKFTRYKDEALITVGCTITADEYVFYVKDNGSGFDMEFSQKLFGIFQRLHGADEFEGSGIGLITVKKIIQRHGGRVWIEGRTGLGAEVYFTLPIAW